MSGKALFIMLPTWRQWVTEIWARLLSEELGSPQTLCSFLKMRVNSPITCLLDSSTAIAEPTDLAQRRSRCYVQCTHCASTNLRNWTIAPTQASCYKRVGYASIRQRSARWLGAERRRPLHKCQR